MFCSIKRPSLNFPQKVSIKRPGLSQILRASVHENQGDRTFFDKVSIKRKDMNIECSKQFK